MALMDVSNLTPEMKAAADPVLPIPNALPAQGQDALSGDQSSGLTQPDNNPAFPLSPNTPGPGASALGGALQNALAKPSNGVPLTFNDKVHANTNAAAEATPPELRNAPGQWARQLISGAQQALGTGLQDFANAKVPEGNHGLMGGIAAVQAAKAQRVQGEQKAQDEHEKNQADIAMMNVQKMYHTMALHKMSDEMIHQQIDDGKAQIQAKTDGRTKVGMKPDKTIAAGLSEAQIQKGIQTGTIDLTKDTLIPDGHIELRNPDGTPMLDPETKEPIKQITWTAMEVPKVEMPTQAQIDRIKKFVPGAEGMQAGVEFPGPQFEALMTQAYQAESDGKARDLALSKADEAISSAKEKQEADEAFGKLGVSPVYQKVRGMLAGDLQAQQSYLSGQYPEIINGKPTGNKDKNSVEAGQDPTLMANFVRAYGGPAKLQSLIDVEAKERERQANDLRVEQEKTRQIELEAQKEKDKRSADLNNHIDGFGNKSPLDDKEFNIRYNKYNAAPQKKTLDTLSGTYDQFQSVLGDVAAGKVTGPESIVALFDAVGISAEPLAGRGFRINNNVIQEHVGARGLDQAAIAKLDKLEKGQLITNDQIRDYAKIALQVYKSAYTNAANEQIRQLGYTDILPRGNGQLIDPVTASMYYQIASNNPQKAAQAATASGWSVNQDSFKPSQNAVKHAVNDVVFQNGHYYKITGVDANGRPTGTEPTAAPAGAK